MAGDDDLHTLDHSKKLKRSSFASESILPEASAWIAEANSQASSRFAVFVSIRRMSAKSNRPEDRLHDPFFSSRTFRSSRRAIRVITIVATMVAASPTASAAHSSGERSSPTEAAAAARPATPRYT